MHPAMLHSRFNRISTIVVFAACALAVVAAVWSGDARLVWVYPAAALGAFAAWAALWRTGIRVDDDGVFIRNVTHTVLVPWDALIQVETRHALTLRTPGHRFQVWSAPAPGTITAHVAGRRADNRELRAVGGQLRPGDLLGTDSGDAAMRVRDAWRERVEAGLVDAGRADELPVTRRLDTGAIGTFAVLTAITVAVLAVSG